MLKILRNSIFFALLAFLVGCAQLQIPSRPNVIHGETCKKSPRLKVFQVLDDGILAYLCPTDYPSLYDDAFEACIVKGDLVYMPVAPKTNDYVDNQKVTLPQSQCFAANGTYSYTRRDGHTATVRKIKILKEESNPVDGTKKTP